MNVQPGFQNFIGIIEIFKVIPNKSIKQIYKLTILFLAS